MNFKLKKTIGDHKILSIDIIKHKFIEFFKDLYNTNSLNTLHVQSQYNNMNNICDIETDLHKIFYNKIKSDDTFKKLYCNLIKDIHNELFSDEDILIYQSFPSVRFQYINNIAVPPHCDSDNIGKHPIGEKNFLLPITEMVKTKRLFIESEPSKGDFQGIDLEYGDLFYFNGNKCIHYNEVNIEDTIRISLDFRVLTIRDYIQYIENNNITHTNPRDPDKSRKPVKMIVGGYYQLTYKADTIEKMLYWYNQKETIIQTRPNFDGNEAEALYTYAKNKDNFYTEFKKTEELESIICNFIKCKHCIMTVNGNVALILALMSLDIKQGDDVIVPNYTMIASINSIKILGANPIIVDVDPETLTITKEIIEQNITSNTKAVMHVSLNNRSKNMEEIVDFCKKHNIKLIEDAAQSLGCFINNTHYGTFGDIGCFSLSTPKIISTGQGGFVVTNNDELANKIRMIKNFGRKSGGVDVFDLFGINFKFTDIQAVIGIEQMKKLDYRIKRMREIFNIYYNKLNTICNMIAPKDESWIPWFIDIFIEDRERLIKFLQQHNIQTRLTYPEINKTPMYYSEITLPISNYISSNGLFLPSHTLLTDNEINYICDIIQIYYSNKNTSL
jgi:perosamine synthetase